MLLICWGRVIEDWICDTIGEAFLASFGERLVRLWVDLFGKQTCYFRATIGTAQLFSYNNNTHDHPDKLGGLSPLSHNPGVLPISNSSVPPRLKSAWLNQELFKLRPLYATDCG